MLLIDFRAREIAKWRKNVRTLATQLADIEATAQANDDILLTLHQLSLLLIQKQEQWPTAVENLLQKKLSLSRCRVCIFTASDKTFVSATSRLPIGGKAMATPLARGPQWANMCSYFYLPLKRNKKNIGVIVMATKKENAFPADAARDFTRRLAELVAVAI